MKSTLAIVSMATMTMALLGGCAEDVGESFEEVEQPAVAAPTKFVGNTSVLKTIDPTGLKFAKYWNQITPEIGGKWGAVQSSTNASFNWATLDAVYGYAKTNALTFKESAFVTGFGQPIGTPTLAQVEAWIKSFCARYPDTKIIDVVTDPPPHTTPSYAAALGAGESGSYPWIVKAFKLARKHCPGATLVLNDYSNLEWSDQQWRFINLVKNVRANGGPIDALGLAAHDLKGKSAAVVQASIDTVVANTGLPVYISEYDIAGDDATQLANFKAHIPVFMNTTAVKGVTLWGWIYGSTWKSESGLVKGTTPRPAMTWLMNYLGRPVPPN